MNQRQLATVMALFAAGFVGPAFGAIEEIIVTAERREASLQDTAIAVSVFNGDVIDQFGAQNIVTLANYIPNVTISRINNSLFINTRGVSSNDQTAIGDPSTAFHIDGTYITRTRGAASVFFDIDRIEFLRGPQGTLWGRNATAGSMNVITNKPKKEFEAVADLQVGDYSEIIARGAVNVPINDVFSARLAGYYNERDGYANSGPLVSDDYDDADDTALRLHLLYEPSEALSFLLSGYYHKAEPVSVSNTLLDTLLNGNPRDAPVNTPGSLEQDDTQLSLEINWELGAAVLTSLTSFRTDDQEERRWDLDFTPTNTSIASFGEESEAFSQELRLTSVEPAWGWNWLLGLYYLDEDQDSTNVVLFDDFLPNPMGPMFPPLDAIIDIRNDPIEAESIAAFGNFTRPLTETLEAVLGLRYTADEKSQTGGQTTTAIIPAPPPIGPIMMPIVDLAYENEEDWDQFDWKLGLNWRPNDASLYYLSVATGYKSGQFNIDGSEVRPEEVTSYEFGAKNQLLDNTLQLNGTIFYMDYEDLQRQVFEVSPAGGVGAFTRNATEATIWGFEGEGIWAPIDPLRMHFTLAYLNTEYDDYLFTSQNPPVVGPITTVQLEGNTLPFSPEWTLNVGGQYTWDLSNLGALTAFVNFYWEDDFFTGDQNLRPEEFQESFTQTDARLTWDSPGRRISVEAFVRNIEDEDVIRNGFNIPPSGWKYILDPPRTYGMRFTVRWP